MWCPKCKTEYVDGVTVCADCGRTLVEELTPEMYEEDEEELIIPKNLEKKLEEFGNKQKQEMDLLTDEPAKVYVKKDYKLEDVKSTAYTFILIGLAGIVALILINLNLIPLSMAGYMKILMTVVMGILFFVFLIIGIRYFTKIKDFKAEVDQEKEFTDSICNWFHENYSAKRIDAAIAGEDELSVEQLYFQRYQLMQQVVKEQYPDLDSSYEDFILEKIYNDMFPDHE